MKIIKKLGGGTISETFLVEKGGKKFVYKKFPLREGWEISMGISEVFFWKTIKRKKLNIKYPEIIETSIKIKRWKVKITGEPYILMEYIKGRQLRKINTNIIEILSQICSELHSVRSKLFIRPIFYRGQAFFRILKKGKNSLEKNELERYKKGEFLKKHTEIIKWLLKNYHNFIEKKEIAHLVHGDLWTNNMLIKSNEIYLIDAGFSGYRFLEYDLRKVRTFLLFKNKSYFDRFIKKFIDKTGLDKEWLIRRIKFFTVLQLPYFLWRWSNKTISKDEEAIYENILWKDFKDLRKCY